MHQIPQAEGVEQSDPLSPLLHEFTYAAMVNDVLPVNNDRYRYTYVGNNNQRLSKEVLLNDTDPLYKQLKHMHIAEHFLRIGNVNRQPLRIGQQTRPRHCRGRVRCPPQHRYGHARTSKGSAGPVLHELRHGQELPGGREVPAGSLSGSGGSHKGRELPRPRGGHDRRVARQTVSYTHLTLPTKA